MARSEAQKRADKKYEKKRAPRKDAWENPIRCRQRNGTDDPPLWISVGSLPDGRFAELIGFMDIDGVWCVFHAMVPPTKKFKRELGWR